MLRNECCVGYMVAFRAKKETKKKEGRAGMTTGYLEKLKAEMEERLGCGIDVVEDKDSVSGIDLNKDQ